MPWSWVTQPDGSVAVDRGHGAGLVVEESLPVAQVVETAERTMSWRDLVEEKAAKYSVPPSWLLAFIFAESGGKADAQNFCCTGLVAIMTQPPVHGKTKAQMLDPEQNLDYGGHLLAQSQQANELPGVASVHVAGPKKGTLNTPKQNIKSPWGMSEHMWLDKPQGDGSVGYIDRVVRANNMFVRLLEEADGKVPPGRTPPPTLPIPPPAPMMSAAVQVGAFGVGAVAGLWAVRALTGRR